MCDVDFQKQQLDLLRKILAAQETANYIDQDYNISATKGFFLDYKKRRHLYMFSPTSLTLLLPDIGGQLAIAANNWTDISFREGLQVFTSAVQTTDVLVHVRASDETIAGASVGGLGQSVTQGTSPWVVSVQNANANGQALMVASQPVVLASDQSNVPMNLKQVNTVVHSVSNPVYAAQSLGSAVLSDVNAEPNISNIQQMTLNGKVFTCSTGKITAAANQAGSWFSANTSTKNKIIWSVRITYTNANQPNEFRWLTADDATIAAGTSDIGNVLNHKGGGAGPEAATVMHHTSGLTAPAIGATTLPLDYNEIQSALTTELLGNGAFLYLPAGVAGGIANYSGTTATGFWSMTVRWSESS